MQQNFQLLSYLSLVVRTSEEYIYWFYNSKTIEIVGVFSYFLEYIYWFYSSKTICSA